MNRAYDHLTALKLIPLLTSVTTEFLDRSRAIRRQARALAKARAARLDGDLRRGLEADLAHERRELRHCEEELNRLGCILESGSPCSVLIPGRGAEGWRWVRGEKALHELYPLVPAA